MKINILSNLRENSLVTAHDALYLVAGDWMILRSGTTGSMPGQEIFVVLAPSDGSVWRRLKNRVKYGGYKTRYGVDQKKVNLVLDQLERCGFLHGVQYVSNNTSIVILDIAKF